MTYDYNYDNVVIVICHRHGNLMYLTSDFGVW